MTAHAVPDRPLTLATEVSREYLVQHRICPRAWRDDGKLEIAAAPDADFDGLPDLAAVYKSEVVVETVASAELDALIERLATHSERSVELARAGDSPTDLDSTADVRDLANQPPVIRYVNLLVRDAHDARASDIHLEATNSGLAARFRLDGVLSPAPEPPSRLHHAVVSRIKLLADLDIAERRRPQDGRIRVRLDAGEIDVRVSTIPTMYGESVVLRLLDQGGRPVTLDMLGMSDSVLESMQRFAQRPHGMVLVTGPTGSGKTTTLYSAIQMRSASLEKIITVEDPIEYQLPGIAQVPVHRQAGVTFASALRAILRQDPDVIMIGEMRDAETAEIAVQAAMTGHLVFSTMHTNDAIGAIPRLQDLGVAEYLIGATLEAVLAQRLVRRVCHECRVPYSPSPESVASLSSRPVGKAKLLRGAGCASCRGTGFRGRVGVFELLAVTDEMKDLVSRRVSRQELRDAASRGGLVPLRSDAWLKVEAGITTVEEVLRVMHD